jgi:hypothetical protein
LEKNKIKEVLKMGPIDEENIVEEVEGDEGVEEEGFEDD